MKAAGADQAGSEVVSQSVAAPAPLATLSKKSPGDRVPVSPIPALAGRTIDLMVLFSLLAVPDFVLGNTLYRDTLWI
jgi:hypothetical protein